MQERVYLYIHHDGSQVLQLQGGNLHQGPKKRLLRNDMYHDPRVILIQALSPNKYTVSLVYSNKAGIPEARQTGDVYPPIFCMRPLGHATCLSSSSPGYQATVCGQKVPLFRLDTEFRW
jgi:hypothetical protein